MFSKHGLWMAIRRAALPRVLRVLPFLCMVTAPDAGGPLTAHGLLPKVPVADPIGIVTIPKVSVADPNVIVIIPMVIVADPNVMVIIPMVIVADPIDMVIIPMVIVADPIVMVIIPMVIVADPNDIVTDPLVKGPAGRPEQRAEPHAPPFPTAGNTPKPLPSLGCSEFWPSWRRWLFGTGNDGYLPDSQHFDQQGSKKCRERRFVPISRSRHVVPLSPMVIMIIPTPAALGRCQRRNRASFRGTQRKARPPPATLSSDLPYLLGPARIHRRARRSGGGHGKPARAARASPSLKLIAMSNIVKGLKGLNPKQLIMKALFIEGRMTGNAKFPDPTPTLAEVADARESLEVAVTAAEDGGRTLTAVRNERARELKLLLDRLAGYVASLAEGDAEAILSSGYAVKRGSSPVGELPAPADLRAEITAYQGRIDLRWKPVRGAAGYQVYQCDSEPTDKTTWHQVGVTTSTRYKVTGLASAHTYWFRVAPIGAAGVGPLSEVAHSLAR